MAKYTLPQNRIFKKEDLIQKLNAVMEKSLGDVDSAGVFKTALKNPKVTGIAGNVVEQSVLGYEQNSGQEPDILVDGVYTEVKTTGIKVPKKKKGTSYEAKEPMSVTAVSPEKIIFEEFETSHFWEKLENLLMIYYLYNSETTVKAIEYANFPLKGYEFHKFSEEDRMRLKKDWEIVRDFIIFLNTTYIDYEKEYHRISHELRSKLMYIDTAPKWPNRPRFRLKRSVVTAMIENHFDKSLVSETLNDDFDSYTDIDDKCHELTKKYKGKTVEQLIDILEIKINDIDNLSKNISEQIIVRMFGGKSLKMRNVELFRKIGMNMKTIVLSSKGARTEDTKLIRIDFDEIENDSLTFDNSSIYDFFMNRQMLCIVFEEKDENQRFKENKFVGFKRLCFEDKFVDEEVETTWNNIRDLVLNNKLRDIVVTKKDGTPKVNKTGVISSAPNFPKSKANTIFVRGDSSDSTSKPLTINGIRMYRQYLWIKGKVLIELLSKINYL